MFIFQVGAQIEERKYYYKRNKDAKPLLKKGDIGTILRDVINGKPPEHYNITPEKAKEELIKLGLSPDLADYWLEGMKRVVGEEGGYAYWALQFATNLWVDSAKGKSIWWNDKFICYFDDKFNKNEVESRFPGKKYDQSKAGLKDLKDMLEKEYQKSKKEMDELAPKILKQEETRTIIEREGYKIAVEKKPDEFGKTDARVTTIVTPEERIIDLENPENLTLSDLIAAKTACEILKSVLENEGAKAKETGAPQKISESKVNAWRALPQGARDYAKRRINLDGSADVDGIFDRGEITHEDVLKLEEKMGASIGDAVAKLSEEIIRLDNIINKLQSILLPTQASSDSDEIKTTYDTTNPKETVATIEKRDLALYATIIEKTEDFWKKYFFDSVKTAFDYAKSKQPPAVQRFLRVLSDNVKDLSQMANRLDLIDRTMGYGINLISFSQDIKNAGQVLTRTDLLNLGYDPNKFSAFVKTEKTGEVFRLNSNVVPTLVFFGIFKFEKGELKFTRNGEKYFKEWCKENGYDPDKIRAEVLAEFSLGVLSSVGQSFLNYAVKRAMKDNGITEKDLETFRNVQTRAKATRAILAERTRELDKRIRELGAERLVLGGKYEENYKEAINNLNELSKVNV